MQTLTQIGCTAGSVLLAGPAGAGWSAPHSATTGGDLPAEEPFWAQDDICDDDGDMYGDEALPDWMQAVPDSHPLEA